MEIRPGTENFNGRATMSCNRTGRTLLFAYFYINVFTLLILVIAWEDRPTLNYGLSCTRGPRLNLNQLYCLMLLTTVYCALSDDTLQTGFHTSLLLGGYAIRLAIVLADCMYVALLYWRLPTGESLLLNY